VQRIRSVGVVPSVSLSDRGKAIVGLAPIVFGPRTLLRTLSTRPIPPLALGLFRFQRVIGAVIVGQHVIGIYFH
jgi:hypothetical protein